MIKDLDLSKIGKNMIQKEEDMLQEVNRFAGRPPVRNTDFGKLKSLQLEEYNQKL